METKETLQVEARLKWKRLGERNKSSPPPFIHKGPINELHVLVQRAPCIKRMNK